MLLVLFNCVISLHFILPSYGNLNVDIYGKNECSNDMVLARCWQYGVPFSYDEVQTEKQEPQYADYTPTEPLVWYHFLSYTQSIVMIGRIFFIHCL